MPSPCVTMRGRDTGGRSLMPVQPAYRDVVDLYARVSSDPQEQLKYSHDAQFLLMREALARKNLREGKAWKETYTAGTAERPEMDPMLVRVRAGVVAHIFVANLDRFSRDQIDVGYLLHLFRQHGVILHAIAENLDTATQMGRERIIQLAGYAEYDRVRLFDRMCGGRIERTDKQTPHSWRIVWREAVVIRRMFAWALAGWSHQAIADELNRRRITPPSGVRGGFWWANRVGAMLGNLMYTGDYLWGREDA